MSNNAVQPIETSHYTYDAHKSPANNKQQDSSTHHSSSTPTASKIHPVEKPIEHPHTTTAIAAAPAQHPHVATAAVERPHAVAEHAQHPAVHPSAIDEKQKHPQPAAVEHSHVAFEHPKVVAIPTHPSTSSRPAVEHIEDKQHNTLTPGIEHPDADHPHHHNHNHNPHHNRSHNPHSQHETGEQAPHSHTYTETPHPAHPAHHSATNTAANDSPIPSDSILVDSAPLSNSNGGGYSSGNAERRQSWSKDEMKRGVMEGLLEGEGKRKGARGGYSSTSADAAKSNGGY